MRQDQAIKKLGRDTVDEMDAMRDTDLKRIIVEATTAMKQVAEELNANKEYQELKQKLSDVTQGKREVDARQKAKISYSLDLLERFGKMDEQAAYEWEKNRPAKLKEIAARKEAAAKKAAETAPSAVRHIKVAQANG